MGRPRTAYAALLLVPVLACGATASPRPTDPSRTTSVAGSGGPAVRVPPQETEDTRAARKRLLDDCADAAALAAARTKNEAACKARDSHACNDAAKAYLCGTDTAKRGELAITLFEQGCALRDGRSCTAAAYLFEHALDVPRDPKRAAAILEQACTDDIEEACNGYTALLLERKPALAVPVVRVLRAACDKGNAEACAALASVVREDREDMKADPALAFGAAEKSCQAKNAVGCAGLASFLSLGFGTKKDPKRAATIAARACDEGVALGCRLAYFAYDKGDGVTKDEAKAKDFLKRGCALEVTESCAQVR
jgi:uncharacterized protein